LFGKIREFTGSEDLDNRLQKMVPFIAILESLAGESESMQK
jgi:hypothetical protein